jgi:hypothetical protein
VLGHLRHLLCSGREETLVDKWLRAPASGSLRSEVRQPGVRQQAADSLQRKNLPLGAAKELLHVRTANAKSTPVDALKLTSKGYFVMG